MSGFQVVLDIDRIAADLCAAEERPVRASEVRELLKRLGFIPVRHGEAWLTTTSCMALLASRLGPGANPFKTSAPHREPEVRSHDDLVEVEAAWGRLSPSKRREILHTIRAS